MDGFTIVDGVVALVVVISALLAYARGFVRELMAILGWIVAAIVAFLFADDARGLIAQVPYVGDFIGDSCELGIIAAFAAWGTLPSPCTPAESATASSRRLRIS